MATKIGVRISARRKRISRAASTALLVGVLASAGSPAFSGVTTRVSVDSAGAQANGLSDRPSISPEGRYVSFESLASNLVEGDTNGVADVFVHDRLTREIVRVSVSSAGTQSDNGSAFSSISADGRCVAFQSIATNLVPDDTNGQIDVFVHELQSGLISRVSVRTGGGQVSVGGGAPAISADGRYVAFMSPADDLVDDDTNGTWDVFVHDRLTVTTTRVSVASDRTEGNGPSTSPAISADGRYVAFVSAASNLVLNDTNGVPDVFVHDRETGATERVSVDSAGTEGNNFSGALGSFHNSYLSADGRYVAFVSAASNLVLDDTNGVPDIFVHDRETGATERVSVDSAGQQSNDVSFFPSISADGRLVAFGSFASNLVLDDTNGVADAFVHDRQTRVTSRVSVNSQDIEGNNHTPTGDDGPEPPAISADGRYVAFSSAASNLVPDDTNGWWDVFVRDRNGASLANELMVGSREEGARQIFTITPTPRRTTLLAR